MRFSSNGAGGTLSYLAFFNTKDRFHHVRPFGRPLCVLLLHLTSAAIYPAVPVPEVSTPSLQMQGHVSVI